MRDQRSGLGQIIQIMCAAAFLSMTAAAQTYITTGQTGAQTQIDVNHTSTWTFTPASNTTLSGGYFTMKDGSATTADVTLSLYAGPTASLYAGPTATGAPLATITLDHTT